MQLTRFLSTGLIVVLTVLLASPSDPLWTLTSASGLGLVSGAVITPTAELTHSWSLSDSSEPSKSGSLTDEVTATFSRSRTFKTPSRSFSDEVTVSKTDTGKTPSFSRSPSEEKSLTFTKWTRSLSNSRSLTEELSATFSRRSWTESSTVTPIGTDTRTRTASATRLPSRTRSRASHSLSEELSMSLSARLTETKTRDTISFSHSLSEELSLSKSFLSASMTGSQSASDSEELSLSRTLLVTNSLTLVLTNTKSLALTLTPSRATRSWSEESSLSKSPSADTKTIPTPSSSEDLSLSESFSRSASFTSEQSLSRTPTYPTGSRSYSLTRSATAPSLSGTDSWPTPTGSLSGSPSEEISSSDTRSPRSRTIPLTLSHTGTETLSASRSMSEELSSTDSLSTSLTPSSTISPPKTRSSSATQSPPPSVSFSKSPSEEISLSKSATITPPDTPTGSMTRSLSDEPTMTDSASQTLSSTLTPTVTPPPTATGALTLTVSSSLSESGPTPSLSSSKTSSEELSLSHSRRTGTPSTSLTESMSTSVSRPTESWTEEQSFTRTSSLTKSATAPTLSDSGATPTLSASDSDEVTITKSMTLLPTPTDTTSSTLSLSLSRGSSTYSMSEDVSASRTVTATVTPPPTPTPSVSDSLSFSEDTSATESMSKRTRSLSEGTGSEELSLTKSYPSLSRSTSLTQSREVTVTFPLTSTKTNPTDSLSEELSATKSAGSFTETVSLSKGSASESQSSSEEVTSTRTITPPPTPTRTASPTFSGEPTTSKSMTLSGTFSNSKTFSEEWSQTDTITPPPTPTRTFSEEISMSHSLTTTQTITPPPTPSATATVSKKTSSMSFSQTATITPPPTPTPSRTTTFSSEPSLSRSPTDEPSLTHSLTATATRSVPPTPSATISLSATTTLTMTHGTLTLPATPSLSEELSLTRTRSRRMTMSLSATDSLNSLSASATHSPSEERSLSKTGKTSSPSISQSFSQEISMTQSVTSMTRLLTLSKSINTLTVTRTISPPPTPTPTRTTTITPPPTDSHSKTLTASASPTISDFSATEDFSLSSSLTKATNTPTDPTPSRSMSASRSGPTLLIVHPIYPKPNSAPIFNPSGPSVNRPTASPNDRYYFFPKLYSNAITLGTPESERTLRFELLGGEFDLARASAANPVDPSEYFFNCITLLTGSAPKFQSRLFRMWTRNTFTELNATTMTLTFPFDAEFPQLVNTELLVIQFAPRCFVRDMTPSPSEYRVVLVPGGTTTFAPPPIFSQSAADTSSTSSSLAAMSTSFFGVPVMAPYLGRAQAALNLAQCIGMNSPLAFFEHPTGQSLVVVDAETDLKLGPFVGALVYDLVIALSGLVLHYMIGVVVYLFKSRKQRSNGGEIDTRDKPDGWFAIDWKAIPGWKRPMVAARFPGLSAWLFLFFPACVKCAVVVFFKATQIETQILAVFMIVPWVLVFVFIWFTTFKARSFAEYINVREIETKRRRIAIAQQHYQRSMGRENAQWGVFTENPERTSIGGASSDHFSVNGIRMQPTRYDAEPGSFYQDPMMGLSKKESALSRFFFAGGIWVNRFDHRSSFVEIFGSFFECYRYNRFRYVLALELLVSGICGFIDGFAIAHDNCLTLSILLVVVLSLHLIAITWARPFDAPFNNCFFVFLSALQLVLAILTLVANTQLDKNQFTQYQRTVQILAVLFIVFQYIILSRAIGDFLRGFASLCLRATGQLEASFGDLRARNRRYKAAYQYDRSTNDQQSVTGRSSDDGVRSLTFFEEEMKVQKSGGKRTRSDSGSTAILILPPSHSSVPPPLPIQGRQTPRPHQSDGASTVQIEDPADITVGPTLASHFRSSATRGGPPISATSRQVFGGPDRGDPLAGLVGLLAQPQPQHQYQHSPNPRDAGRGRPAESYSPHFLATQMQPAPPTLEQLQLRQPELRVPLQPQVTDSSLLDPRRWETPLLDRRVSANATAAAHQPEEQLAPLPPPRPSPLMVNPRAQGQAQNLRHSTGFDIPPVPPMQQSAHRNVNADGAEWFDDDQLLDPAAVLRAPVPFQAYSGQYQFSPSRRQGQEDYPRGNTALSMQSPLQPSPQQRGGGQQQHPTQGSAAAPPQSSSRFLNPRDDLHHESGSTSQLPYLDVDPLAVETSKRTVDQWFEEGLQGGVKGEWNDILSGAPRPPTVPPPSAAPSMPAPYHPTAAFSSTVWDDVL